MLRALIMENLALPSGLTGCNRWQPPAQFVSTIGDQRFCIPFFNLVAPYRAILRYYRCDTPYRAILLKGSYHSPKIVRYPTLVLSFTKAYLCDTPFCYTLRDNCAIPHENKHETLLRYYRYKYRAI